MRLIDADALLKEFDPDGEPVDPIAARMKIVRQPTAYDVDKVVEQLETRKSYLLREFVLADKAQSVKETSLDRINEIDGNIEIVKAGGADE